MFSGISGVPIPPVLSAVCIFPHLLNKQTNQNSSRLIAWVISVGSTEPPEQRSPPYHIDYFDDAEVHEADE